METSSRGCDGGREESCRNGGGSGDYYQDEQAKKVHDDHHGPHSLSSPAMMKSKQKQPCQLNNFVSLISHPLLIVLVVLLVPFQWFLRPFILPSHHHQFWRRRERDEELLPSPRSVAMWPCFEYTVIFFSISSALDACVLKACFFVFLLFYYTNRWLGWQCGAPLCWRMITPSQVASTTTTTTAINILRLVTIMGFLTTACRGWIHHAPRPTTATTKMMRSTSSRTTTTTIRMMATTPQEGKVGFMGLGYMGNGMVRRLLTHGFPVVVWNRR